MFQSKGTFGFVGFSSYLCILPSLATWHVAYHLEPRPTRLPDCCFLLKLDGNMFAPRHLECHCLMIKVCGFCVCAWVLQNKFQNFTKPPPLWVFDARCPDPMKSWKFTSDSWSRKLQVGSTLLIRVFQVYHTPRNKKVGEPFKWNDGISEAGIFFGSILLNWGDFRSPSFSSTNNNHRWNFSNDVNLQSFQPSQLAQTKTTLR